MSKMIMCQSCVRHIFTVDWIKWHSRTDVVINELSKWMHVSCLNMLNLHRYKTVFLLMESRRIRLPQSHSWLLAKQLCSADGRNRASIFMFNLTRSSTSQTLAECVTLNCDNCVSFGVLKQLIFFEHSFTRSYPVEWTIATCCLFGLFMILFVT